MNKFIEMARAVAFKSHSKYRHGAVLIKGGRVISSGVNNPAYSSVADRHNNNKLHFPGHIRRERPYGTLHAEIDCVNNTTPAKNLKLYVVRISSLGELCNSKPCSMCMSFLMAHNIKKVTYSVSEREFRTIDLRKG